MSKDKYVIKQIINRKPVPMPISELKEDGMFLGIRQNMISQIVEAKNNREFEFVCSQIQNFIEENNISVCFAINKNELTDCLQEHQMLKLKIADLEAKLAESEEKINMLEEHKFYADNIIKAYADKCKNAQQDKISFAVEKLEKVKNYLTQELENVTELLDPLEYEDYHELIGCGRGYKNSIEEIDNQIKQLKEGVKCDI